MKVAFRIPRIVVGCESCKSTAHIADLYGDRAEVTLVGCLCPIPQLVLLFFYPESTTPAHRIPLEESGDRRIRQANEALV